MFEHPPKILASEGKAAITPTIWRFQSRAWRTMLSRPLRRLRLWPVHLHLPSMAASAIGTGAILHHVFGVAVCCVGYGGGFS